MRDFKIKLYIEVTEAYASSRFILIEVCKCEK